VFVGHHQRSLDKKGRMLVPARLLKRLPDEDGQISLYVMLLGDHLGLYPPQFFLERVSEQRPRGFATDRKLTAMLSLAEEVSLDSANRLRLTARHREAAGLEKELVLVGVGDHLEIWNPDTLAAMEQKYLDDFGDGDGGAE